MLGAPVALAVGGGVVEEFCESTGFAGWGCSACISGLEFGSEPSEVVELWSLFAGAVELWRKLCSLALITCRMP